MSQMDSICNKCKHRDSCLVVCEKLEKQLEDIWPSNKLKPDDVVDYAVLVLAVSGLSIRKILYASRILAKYQKSTIGSRINTAKDRKEELVGYFLERRKKTPLFYSMEDIRYKKDD